MHQRSTLSTVHDDDTGGNKDMNDLILEVAVVKPTPDYVLGPRESISSASIARRTKFSRFGYS